VTNRGYLSIHLTLNIWLYGSGINNWGDPYKSIDHIVFKRNTPPIYRESY